MNRAWLTRVAMAVAMAVAATPSAAQQMWAPSGVPLCRDGRGGDIPQVVSDGAGGAFVAWRDGRNSDDVFLQHVLATGSLAPGWPLDGAPVAVLPSVQEFSHLVADGSGGALVAWEDWRNLSASSRDPYVQRILSNGSLSPGWVLYGNPATLAPGAQYAPQVAADGSGGAFVLWMDDRDYSTTGYDVYAQHLTASGAVAPGWPAWGLPVCTLPGNQGGIYFVMPDDSGGAVFEWLDGRPGAPGGYALRVRGDGTVAPGWSANGNRLSSGAGAAGRDEAGGFYLATSTPGPNAGFDGSYYLLRFTFAGTPAPGWPAGGVLVCNAPGNRGGVAIDADGTGGVLVSWYDYRPPYDFTGGQIFAARALPDASLAPGWNVDGTLVSDPTAALQSYTPFIARDGQGGGYVVWQSQGGTQSPSTIQHLTGSGQAAAGWPQYGLRVAPSGRQADTRIAADGQGGAIVAWDEGCCGRVGVWAQRFASDGPTPVLVSLASVAAEPERVTLVWQLAGGVQGSATVSRRTSTLPWEPLGAAVPEGAERLRYEDRSVIPGGRYAYRLDWSEGNAEQLSAETWVDVPQQLALALEGFRPNPSVGSPTVAFTLSDAEPATLEAYDIAGRQVIAREVGSLGPGRHLLKLEAGGLGPGVYHLRLRKNGAALAARGLIIR